MKDLRRKLLMLVLIFGAAFVVSAAQGADVIKTKDGRTYEGVILTETSDLIEIEVTIGSNKQKYTLFRDDVSSITRDTPAAGKGATDPAGPGTPANSATEASAQAGAPPIDFEATRNKRVFVIPMYGGVGQTFRADKLKEAVEAARPFKPDVIVLLIDSPGGAVSEIYKLRDYLQEAREEFRIVCWIKSAISAAAMTSINVNEIYFMKEGHIGAATMWYMNGGQATAVRGKELEDFIEKMQRAATLAGHSPELVHSMIDKDIPCSADREELPNGEIRVTWHGDESGQYLVNKPGNIVTLTASQALLFRVSYGTADTPEELAKFLNLDGWIEVSDAGRKIMDSWKETYETGEKEIPALFEKYNYLRGRGAASEREQQRQLGELANIVRELIKWCKKSPAFEENFGLREEDLERDLKRIIREMEGLGG